MKIFRLFVFHAIFVITLFNSDRLSAQQRTVEMVQPMPIGFRIYDNLGFRQKDKFLYYWFWNNARASSQTLMRYDTKARVRQTVFGPLGAYEYAQDSRLSASGRFLYFKSNARSLLRKHKVTSKFGYFILDTRTGKTSALDLARTRGAFCFTQDSEPCSGVMAVGFSKDEKVLHYLTFHLIASAPTVTQDDLPALVSYNLSTKSHTLLGSRIAQHKLYDTFYLTLQSDASGFSVALELRNRETKIDEQLGEVLVDPGTVLYPPDASPIAGAPLGNGAYRYIFASGTLQPLNIEISGVPAENVGISCGSITTAANLYVSIANRFNPETFDREGAACYLKDLLQQHTTPFSCKALPKDFNYPCSESDLGISANGKYFFSKTNKSGREEVIRYNTQNGTSVVVTAPFIGTFHNGQYPPSFTSMSSNGAMFSFADGSSFYVRNDSTVDDFFLVRIKG